MFQFGFELEGFYKQGNKVVLPPDHYPVDGFPGLCEVRTTGGAHLEDAYFNLCKEFTRFPFCTQTVEHSFTAAERQKLRERQTNKDAYKIGNIYGKEPRLLGNKTLASLQINISNLTMAAKAGIQDKKGRWKVPPQYNSSALFDTYSIVRKLDEEFKKEIRESGRQPGFFSVKDGIRLEYRSLPNSVFELSIPKVKALLQRFEKALS